MDPNFPSATSSPAVPVPPLPAHGAFFSSSSRPSSNSSSTHSRRSLKSLSRLIADHRGHRDPKKLLGLINKLHEQLEFEKDRADRAAQQSSEALLYLKSICQEKLHALRDIARLEEELKLYKIQYDEAQKEIFRAQKILNEVDEKRFRAEKQAADARSALRRAKDEISVIKAQDEGRRMGILEGFKRGREIGIQEGLKMAQEEVVRIVASPPPTLPVIPQVQQHSLSRAPSLVPSRPPTAPPKSPTASSIAHEADDTSQPLQSAVEALEEPGNRSFQVQSPSSQVPLAVIPPDNFIPLLDEDNRIRLPPAFEFSRPASPAPPPQGNEEIRMIPPPASVHVRSARSHRSASSASASPQFSHMEMLANPLHNDRGTPMSVIPESLSQEHSPVATLQRQPSLAASSVRSLASELRSPIYFRPRSISGGSSIMSGQPPPVATEFDDRANVPMEGTAPGMAAQSPYIPNSNDDHDNGASNSIFIPPITETRSHPSMQHQLDANSPMIIPQHQFLGGWDQTLENISSDSMNPPVIPHPDLFTDAGDEDDAVSSEIDSMDSLTTPPERQQRLPSRAGSVRSVGGGSALSHRTGPVAVSHIGSTAGPSRSRAASVMSAGGSALSQHFEPEATSNAVPSVSRAASVMSAGGGSALSRRTGPVAASHIDSTAGPSRSGAASVMSAGGSALSHRIEPEATSNVAPSVSRAASVMSAGGGSALSHRTGPVAASHIGSTAGLSRSRAASVMSAEGSALSHRIEPEVTSNALPSASRAASVRSAGGSALSHRTEPFAASHIGSRAEGSKAGSVMGAAPGASGSAIGTVPDSHWGDLVNSAQSPPPQDAAYTPKTRSKKGESILSMRTAGSRR